MRVHSLPKSFVVLGHIIFVISGVCEASNILCQEGACQLRGRVLSTSEPAEPDLLTWQPATAPVTVQPLHETRGSMAGVVDHAVLSVGGPTHYNPPPAPPSLPRGGGAIRPVPPTAPTATNCFNSSNSLSNSYGPTQNCARYSLSVGFILGGAGCLALLGLVVLGVACGSRQHRERDPETPEALVKLEGPIIGFQVSMPGSTAMTQMAWVEPKAPPELKGDRFISPESTVHSANNYNTSWHRPVFSESGHLMAVGGAESVVALNLVELRTSRGRERGVGEEEEITEGGLLESRRIVQTNGGEEGTSWEVKS